MQSWHDVSSPVETSMRLTLKSDQKRVANSCATTSSDTGEILQYISCLLGTELRDVMCRSLRSGQDKIKFNEDIMKS